MASSSSAQLVAGVSSKVARKLEAVMMVISYAEPEPPAPLSKHCVKVAKFFEDSAPTMVALGFLMQMFLFMSATILRVRCQKLVLAARRYGANGI